MKALGKNTYSPPRIERQAFRPLLYLLHFIAPIIFFNLLVWAYIHINVPVWGYLGYVEDFSQSRYIQSSFLIIFTRLFIPRRIIGFYSFVLATFFSLSIVPMAVLYAARGYDTEYFLASIAFFILLVAVPRIFPFRFQRRFVGKEIITKISILIISLSVAWAVYRGGIARLDFSLATIYDNRPESIERYFQFPFNYINSWAVKVAGPALFAIGLMSRRYWLICIAVLAEVFFFGVYTQKVAVAMLFFTLFAIWSVPRKLPSFGLDVALSIVALGAAAAFFVFGDYQIPAVVINRTLFGPANNNILYYEFFRDNPHTLWSNSLLSAFVEYPLQAHIFDLISIIRTGEAGMNPNTGVLGTGYMHMGYLGLLLYAAIIGLVISVIEAFARPIPAWVPVSIAGPPTFIMLTTTDLSVALLTNGLLLAILMLLLWPISVKPKS